MPRTPVEFCDHFDHYWPEYQLRAIFDSLHALYDDRNIAIASYRDAQQEQSIGSDPLAEDDKINSTWIVAYREAACVQAAVGMLAPYYEGFLKNAFLFLRLLHGDLGAPSNHDRWSRATETFWNPQRGGLARGVRELRDALSLSDWLSNDLLDRLDLLVAYRNKSLHIAYEWPIEEEQEFRLRCNKFGWSQWITGPRCSPGLFVLLTDEFVGQMTHRALQMTIDFETVVTQRGGLFGMSPDNPEEFRPLF